MRRDRARPHVLLADARTCRTRCACTHYLVFKEPDNQRHRAHACATRCSCFPLNRRLRPSSGEPCEVTPYFAVCQALARRYRRPGEPERLLAGGNCHLSVRPRDELGARQANLPILRTTGTLSTLARHCAEPGTESLGVSVPAPAQAMHADPILRWRGIAASIRIRKLSRLSLRERRTADPRSPRQTVSCFFSSVNPPVVHVDAAAADQPRRLALRRRHARRRRAARPGASRSASMRHGRGRDIRKDLHELAHRHRRHIAARTASRLPTSASRTAASPCTIRVTSRASSRCAWRSSGSRAVAASSSAIRVGVEKREELQIPDRVAVVGVEPELIELVGRRQLRIQPDRSRFGLAELVARRRRDERQHQAVRLAAAHAPNRAPCPR